uniref:Kunitz domain n=1 Tax=Argas monolakensis TaxID=34602 RepID=Q09JV5_ARGMO|nr:Kunitz domain [Argas monolakensis]
MAAYGACICLVLLAAVGVASARQGPRWQRHRNCTLSPTFVGCRGTNDGPSYFFNSTGRHCQKTPKNQCSVGANGYKTMSSCVINCNPKQHPGRCVKLNTPQSCLTMSQKLVARWQYNATTGMCTLRHICQQTTGNAFPSLSECMERCSGFSRTHAVKDTSSGWPFTLANTQVTFE